MAHFPDLSLYAYGHHDEIEGGHEDLNVGWLAAEHAFTRGSVPPELEDALLVCATRPARLYRGLHVCDLCNLGVATVDFDGRELLLGNGEIRVLGPDRRWYTAPTLVAHYVVAHEYLPPSAFIDGVIARASTIFVVRGAQLRRLRGLARPERLVVCLRVLRAIAGHQRADVSAVVPHIIEAVQRESDPHYTLWRTNAPLVGVDEVVTSACWKIVIGFSPQHGVVSEDQMIWSSISLMEAAADLGLDVSDY